MKSPYLRYAVAAFIMLSIICLTLAGCSSKKKIISRSNSSEEVKIKKSVSEVENRLEQNEVTAVRKNTIDWSAIYEALNIKPVDPSKPSSAKFTPEENGGWSYQTQNAEVDTSKNQEQKKEINYDSIYTLKLLELERNYQAELKAAAAAQKKAREAESESTRWPFWFLMVPLVLAVLVYFKGWKFWR